MKTIQIKSIQVKFLIWIIPVVTIVLGILALITYQKEKEKQLKFIDDSSAQIVQGRGNEIEKWLKSIILELQQISNHPDVKSMSWKQMEQVLRLIAEKRKDTYGFLILVEKNGDYYSTLKGKADISLKDKDYFRAVFEENKPFAISNPYYSITTGKPIFVINVPILSSDGQLLGSLGGIVYLSTLSKIAADIRIGESGYGWIVDSEGLVFAHPDSSVILKLNVLKSTEKGFENLDKIGSKMLNSKAGAGLVRRPDKVEEYLVFSRIPLSPNWTLGVAVPSAEIFSEVDNLLLRLCVSFFGTLLALTLLIYLLTRIIITKPLKQLTEFTDSVANGHLFRSINIDSKDEIGVMAQSLRKMSHKMSEITEKIKQSSSSIANGSKELSSSTAQIAQGASEQAAAAEEVSAAIEEMTASITQNAENAGLTESIAEKVVKDIEEVMISVKSTLSAISTIAAKITIINEIAGKTDLLAINAAVEAARAGEKGKGFAVVATEVRKLAENSKNASIEINHVSSETVQSAKESGRLLEAVVPLIKKNADLVREIRAASSEQNSGVEQINKAIQQLAQVTQENAASAEEMAASSEELSKQADILNEIIEFFKITEAEVNQNLSLRAYHKMLEAVAVFEQNNKNLIKKSGDSLGTEKGEHGKSGKETKESGVVIDIDNDNLDSDFTQMER